ncbi:hypothetical protein FD755_021683 [Muntiacus reevesi]|uniref:Uncharacterized protein n=1 Tax=Muntiacus reevesi TaxID=9886 RepID=A0A5N3W2M5_MUNRE|nr:hypothetical protein FD755_021683 [Muntiacus reevesi]
MNISEASFTDCLQNTTTEGQLCFFKSEDKIYFGCKLKGMHTVNSYNGSSLCQLGLGLNNSSSELCPGHGRCLTEVWSRHTAVIASHHSLGNISTSWMNALVNHVKKKKKNGSGSSTTEKLNNQGYECICHPPFTNGKRSETLAVCR